MLLASDTQGRTSSFLSYYRHYPCDNYAAKINIALPSHKWEVKFRTVEGAPLFIIGYNLRMKAELIPYRETVIPFSLLKAVLLHYEVQDNENTGIEVLSHC